MVKFDPQKHHRRSIRLQGFDYSSAGAYFVTIVAWHREFLFGEIVEKEIQLNKVGKIVQWEWLELPKRLSYVTLGAHMVMPNHFHGILFIHENVGATRPGLAKIKADIEPLQIDPTDSIEGSPLPLSRGPNPASLAQSLHNSNHVQQNGFGNFQNSKKHQSGSATITNMSFAMTKTCKIKPITSRPIHYCGRQMMRTLSM